MSDAIDTQAPIDRIKIYMELRGLRPNTVYSFSHCARNLLAHMGNERSRSCRGLYGAL